MLNTTTTYQGLNATQVAESRQRNGVNILTPPKKKSLLLRFLNFDPIIIILLVAGFASLGIACYEYYGAGHGTEVFLEPIGIFVAIFLATGLSFFFEVQADKEFELLNQVNDEEAVRVIREGKTIEVPKSDLVVGDIVRIGTGEDIPADGRLLEATLLNVDESTLTGEPLCHKTTVEAEFDQAATYASNMVMRGTKVMEGHGIFEVTAVGDATENGKVFVAAQIDNSVKTPLNEQLDSLGKLLSKLAYALAVLILVGRTILYFTHLEGAINWLDFTAHALQTVMIAVTLIVVAVPEGLPMAVTLSLAYSMRRMLKTNNLVRKMHACETMGATTVICTDKTGTLTQNQMRVAETNFYDLPDQQLNQTNTTVALITENIALNSTATLDFSQDIPKVLGNPTEGALLLHLHAQGVDFMNLRTAAQIVEELPFATERKYMAVVVRSSQFGGKKVLYVKGAPEIVFALCPSETSPISKNELDSQLLSYQNKAMRTLGFAYQVLDENEVPISDARVVAKRLQFQGFVAISDPVRADVPQAIKECISAGIAIKIVTGDTIATAREIGRQIGLWQEGDGEQNIITGPEFEALSDEALWERIEDLKIIARARPMDKKRLVETLQKRGHVVAVTGDGTNDAPALKTAHVGLSMGDGTSVAKEASDITIIDNSFSSIGRAVMWGRSLYQNIQRFLLFQLTVNVVACLVVLAGAFIGQEPPLTVTQMLWVNLIMDTFAAMALASLPPSERVMNDKPRDRQAFIISPRMKRTILTTAVVFFLCLLSLTYIFEYNDITALTQLSTLNFGISNTISRYEQSLFFTIFVMMQFWNMFNARAYQTGKTAFNFKGAQSFVLIMFFILIGQVAIVHLGGEMFSVTGLTFNDWLWCIVGTSPILLVGELLRWLKKTSQKK